MEYRLASSADAAQIADLIQTTWNTPASAKWIAGIVAMPRHTVWLASGNGAVAGFCAGFMTVAFDGTARWEVDLLAVHPNMRKKGVGKTLVAKSVQTGWSSGATFQRGLVAAQNVASERCFATNGFLATVQCELWVGPPATILREAKPPPCAHFVSVETLTYEGIWVEGCAYTEALAAAQQRAYAEGRNTVGAVIPSGSPHACADHSFARVDSYQWWTLTRDQAYDVRCARDSTGNDAVPADSRPKP